MSQSIEVESDIIEKGIQKRNKILADAEIQSQKIQEGAKAEAARISAEADKQILQIVGSELKTVRLRIIGKTELQNRRITIGCFPWLFEGGESAFARVVAFLSK